MSAHIWKTLGENSRGTRKALRTYSRRNLTRRMSSPPVPPPITHHQLRLTQSFDASQLLSTSPADEIAQQPAFPVPGPKRVRFSESEQTIKSPTELFFEGIISSATQLLESENDQLEEAVLSSVEIEDADLIDEEVPLDTGQSFSSKINESETHVSEAPPAVKLELELEESILEHGGGDDDGKSGESNRQF